MILGDSTKANIPKGKIYLSIKNDTITHSGVNELDNAFDHKTKVYFTANHQYIYYDSFSKIRKILKLTEDEFRYKYYRFSPDGQYEGSGISVYKKATELN